jgi:hypothetical protein
VEAEFLRQQAKTKSVNGIIFNRASGNPGFMAFLLRPGFIPDWRVLFGNWWGYYIVDGIATVLSGQKFAHTAT